MSQNNQTIETVIDLLGKGEKPWYLSSMEVYRFTKKASGFIPLSVNLFEKALDGIALLTKYINESTRLNVVVEVDQAYEAINKVDNLLSEQLVVLDDGFDELRGKLASSLRQLLTALVKHKEWAQEVAGKTKTEAVSQMTTRYEQALNFLSSIIKAVQEKYPQQIESVTTMAATVKNSAHAYVTAANSVYTTGVETVKTQTEKTKSQLLDTIMSVLKTAQPYVHAVVQTSSPYITKTVEAAQPYYLTHAKPYVDPLVGKAEDVRSNLKENKLYGPYVHLAETYAEIAFEETKSYVLPASVTVEAAH